MSAYLYLTGDRVIPIIVFILFSEDRHWMCERGSDLLTRRYPGPRPGPPAPATDHCDNCYLTPHTFHFLPQHLNIMDHWWSLVMTTFSMINPGLEPTDWWWVALALASRDSSRSAQIQLVFKNVNFLLVDCELSERGIAMSRLFLASSRPRTAGTKINSARLFSHLPRNLVRPPEISARVIKHTIVRGIELTHSPTNTLV